MDEKQLLKQIEQANKCLEMFADKYNWLRPVDEETMPVWIGPSITTEEIDRRPWEFAKKFIIKNP